MIPLPALKSTQYTIHNTNMSFLREIYFYSPLLTGLNIGPETHGHPVDHKTSHDKN